MRYLVEGIQGSSISLDPYAFRRRRDTHNHVFFGQVPVRAYKHGNRWQFVERSTTPHGRLTALPWDPEDLIAADLPAAPRTETYQRSRLAWRRQVCGGMQYAAHMEGRDRGCACSPPSSYCSRPGTVLPGGIWNRGGPPLARAGVRGFGERVGRIDMSSFDVLLDDERTQLAAFVEEYRGALETTLEGLTEEQARRGLVPSSTTLLGLLKHVTWMQRVWFEECVGGTPRRELGLVASPDESFQLADEDSVASVTAAHRDACARARQTVTGLSLKSVVTGHQAGPRTLRWVYLQVLRELAHHCGHADILREQLLAAD